jgi:hypothetical protein
MKNIFIILLFTIVSCGSVERAKHETNDAFETEAMFVRDFR